VAVLLWAGDRWVAGPLIRGWSDRGHTIEGQMRALQKSRSLLSQADEIQVEYDQLRESFQLTGRPEDESTGSLRIIERLAQSALVRIQDIKPLPIRKGDVHIEFAVELECTGSIRELARFFYELGEAQGGMTIEKMQIVHHRKGPAKLRAALLVSKIRILTDDEG
jgi:Tfp pilus assembly protein PilO